ncbi:MAG: DUF1338 domain-containing protein, partial [Marinilabiliales bacterium]
MEELLEKLWNDYTNTNPIVQDVYQLFIEKGEKVVNDHIALRTFDDERINIDVLAKVFLKN